MRTDIRRSRVAVTDPPVIKLEDALDRDSVAPLLGRLSAAVQGGAPRVVLDLCDVRRFDSAGLGGVVEGMRLARERGVEVRLRGLSQAMLDFFSLVSIERLIAPAAQPARVPALMRVGGAVLPLIDASVDVVRVGGAALRGAVVALLPRGRQRLDRAVIELDRAANGALPIVVLIGFLLGLILAMQAYVQLRIWGAEIYIADMVGVSAVTEIGPLMTAIVLAARSGSANAAQLGSMVVGEEIDALRQMAVDPLRFLVVPKVVALGFAAVALCSLFDVVAMAGGALFAWAAADIEPAAYFEQTRTALDGADLVVATLKCLSFGLCTGIVGCALGLRVRGGSEGVARATTDAVVASIFLIIVLDTLFVAGQRLLFT